MRHLVGVVERQADAAAGGNGQLGLVELHRLRDGQKVERDDLVPVERGLERCLLIGGEQRDQVAAQGDQRGELGGVALLLIGRLRQTRERRRKSRGLFPRPFVLV